MAQPAIRCAVALVAVALLGAVLLVAFPERYCDFHTPGATHLLQPVSPEHWRTSRQWHPAGSGATFLSAAYGAPAPAPAAAEALAPDPMRALLDDGWQEMRFANWPKAPSGSSSASIGSSDSFGCTQTVLAARQEPEVRNYSNINIGEVLIYNSALSTADQEAVESYLAAKWGIGTGIGRQMQGGLLNMRRDPPAFAQTGDPAKQILQLTGGARTKIVWARGVQGNYSIMILDTDEGRERVLATQSPCRIPFITPSGNRVIVDEMEGGEAIKRIYVMDMNGNKKELCQAYCAMGVAEDPPGTEWAYYADNKHDANPPGKLWRVQIDNPKVREMVWDKTSAGWQWAFTRDGKVGCGGLPWPGSHIANLPNGSYQQVHDSGCMVALAPSGRRMFHCTALQFGGEHRGIGVHSAPNWSSCVLINLGAAPGVNNQPLLWPAWALYDERFFVITGPWTKGARPGNILFGQFNAEFNGIARWVQVTQCPEGVNDCNASCWIQSGPGVKDSPMAGLNLKLLASFVKRLDKALKFKPFLDDLRRKLETSKNPEEAKEAEEIFGRVETWGKQQLEAAAGREAEAPREAMAVYRDVATKMDGMEAGAAAKKRLDDPGFQENLRAAPLFEKFLKAEKALVDVPGAERSAKDAKFTSKNRLKLDEMKNTAQVIGTKFPRAGFIPTVNEILEKYKMDPIKTKAAEDRGLVPAAPTWPADRKDLIFLWENRKGAFLAYDREGKAIPSLILMPRDRARFDHNQGLWLEAGAFPVPSVEKFLLAQKPVNLTLEAYLTPGKGSCPSMAEIVSFSAKSDDANLVLGQLGNKLVMAMKGGVKPAELCALTAGEPVHVVVTYAPGTLTCYKNGKLAGIVGNFQGSPANWTEQHLLFGSNWDGKNPWSGHLEGIAIYTRALGPKEAEQEHAAFAEKLKGRKPVPRIEIQAKLLAKTKTRKFEEIAPYTQATAAYEYEVEKVVSGQCKEKKIRVMHHTMIDRKLLPASQAEIGKSYTLELEPFEANPQLEIDRPLDDLPLDINAVRYYDVGPLRKTPVKKMTTMW